MSTHFPTRQVLLAMAACAFLALCSSENAFGQWGTFKGRFIVDGQVPAPQQLVINANAAVCAPGGKPVFSQNVLVDPETKGLANVVVFLSTAPGEKVPIHQNYQAQAGNAVSMGNEICVFTPRVTLLWTQQTLQLVNDDAIAHNFIGQCIANRPFNLIVPANGQLNMAANALVREERLPVRMSCGMHPWMSGWLVVRDTPYMAVTAADGSFEIPNVPAGNREFVFWHEKLGYVSSVVVNGNGQQWARGRQAFNVAPVNGFDLGDVEIPAQLFNAANK